MTCYGKFPSGKIRGKCLKCEVSVECYEDTEKKKIKH